jgi:hypothetical protein
MKLSSIAEGFWHTYGPNPAGTDTSGYIYYCDMDGVLVDLLGGLSQAGVKTSISPEAILKAIQNRGGDPSDPRAVFKFYMGLPKLPGADAIWKAATEAGGGKPPMILTVCPEEKVPGIYDAKMGWALEHLGPTPTEIYGCRKGGKHKWAGPKAVLIDDEGGNVEDWQKAGGKAIFHHTGSLNSTLQGIANPEGELGVDMDLRKPRGVTTSPTRWGRGGQHQSLTGYDFAGGPKRMSLRNVDVKMPDGSVGKIEVFGMFSVDDPGTKYMVKLFKQHGGQHPVFQQFVNTCALAISRMPRLSKGNTNHRPVDIICMPQSSKVLTGALAARVARELSVPDPVMWAKNRDAATIEINQDGALEYCVANGEDPEQVYKKWQRQVAAWAAGQKDTKNLDRFLRRGNMSNLFVPPHGVDFEGKSVLIIDETSAFHVTMADIASACFRLGASNVMGAVLWLLN